MTRALTRATTLIVVLALIAAGVPARANELRVVGGFGLSFLPMDVAVDKQLIEKQAAALGLNDTKVTFDRISSGSAMNDAIISGSADVALAGVSVMVLLWDKTTGRNAVKGMMAISDTPIYFNTIDPRIKTIRDFQETDRVAMTAGRGTQHALVWQMAAAREFGWDNRYKLDNLTVSMSHPDGVTALLSGGAIVKTHATTVPFIQMELANPNVRTILNSYDVGGGRHTLITAYTTEKWKAANPKLYQAMYKGVSEAMQIIASDKRAAAELFVRTTKSSMSVEDVHRILLDENMMYYSPTPSKVMVWADYMAKTGLIKNKLASWKDVYFENTHDLPGD